MMKIENLAAEQEKNYEKKPNVANPANRMHI